METVAQDDGLDIPDFLRISQERRAAAWLERPPRKPSAQVFVDDLRQQQLELKREKKTARLKAWLGRKAQREQGAMIPKSKRAWCTERCAWVEA